MPDPTGDGRNGVFHLVDSCRSAMNTARFLSTDLLRLRKTTISILDRRGTCSLAD